MDSSTPDPIAMIQPLRRIEGISAVLLPFLESGDIDESALASQIERTADAGLIPAVNMDTGFGHLISDAQKRHILSIARSVLSPGHRFVGGAFVKDQPGDAFNLDAYRRQIDLLNDFGATPVIFQSHGLVNQPDANISASYRAIADHCDAFIAFELTTELGPFGAIYSLDVYESLLRIPQCIGAKHSSFHREPEWRRLMLRDQVRPDFRVYTGNDFGIDMVIYGSDYLLGLSTFAPDLFAKRDAMWEDGDLGFYELNDQLQYLGYFAFRNPGPAYKHSAAQFLKLRDWISCDATHPESPRRPSTDVEILREIGRRLGVVAND